MRYSFMRLFAAIEIMPNDKIRKALSEAKKLGLRAVSEENLHINLKFFGEVGAEKTREIKKALDSAHGFGRFEVKLESTGAFPNSDFIRVLWIGVKSDGLVSLAELIGNELAGIGFNKEMPYIPHVTIARANRKVRGIESLLSGENFGAQMVRELHLIKSELGETGPKYEKIHSVVL